MKLIKVKVDAEAKKDSVKRRSDDSFEISVRAPAERGEANGAVIGILSRELGIPSARLRIIKGGRSSAKIIEIWE